MSGGSQTGESGANGSLQERTKAPLSLIQRLPLPIQPLDFRGWHLQISKTQRCTLPPVLCSFQVSLYLTPPEKKLVQVKNVKSEFARCPYRMLQINYVDVDVAYMQPHSVLAPFSCLWKVKTPGPEGVGDVTNRTILLIHWLKGLVPVDVFSARNKNDEEQDQILALVW